jgi:hypothetical protein
MARRVGRITAYRKLLLQPRAIGPEARLAKQVALDKARSHLSKGAQRIAHVLNSHAFPSVVDFREKHVIYVIFNSNVNFTTVKDLYIGTTRRGIQDRYAEHTAIAWGPNNQVVDSRRTKLYTWMARFKQTDVTCIPIMTFQVGEGQNFHEISAPLERRCISLFRSHVSMGGLNMVWPGGRVAALRDNLRHFDALQYCFARSRDHEDGLLRETIFHPRRYRDYFRRLRALSHFLEEEGHDLAWFRRHLSRFTMSNIAAMFAVMGLTSTAHTLMPPQHFSTIHEYLEGEIRRRTESRAINGFGTVRRRMTFAIYQSRIWDIVQPSRLFTPALMAWLPETLQGFTPLVTFKHTLPLHRRVCNKRHFFQHQTYDQIRGIAEGPCQCHTVPQFIAERHDGHVVTADMQCAGEFLALDRTIHPAVPDKVVSLLSQGTNYRPLQVTHLTPTHRREVMVAWKQGLNNWILKVCRETGVNVMETQQFVNQATRVFRDTLATIPDHASLAFPNTLELGTPEKYAFRKLGGHFLITTCDKASRNFALVCKKRAVFLLLEDLNLHSTGIPVYTVHTQQDISQVTARMEEVVNNFQLTLSDTNRVLPYYSAIPKFHKNPVGIRWLTIGYVGAFVPLYKRTHWACKALKPALQELWKQQLEQTGVPLDLRPQCPELLNSAEAVATIRDCNANYEQVFSEERRRIFHDRFPHVPMSNLPQVVTADVTRLYTHIPHQELLHAVNWLVDQVFDRHTNPNMRGARFRVARPYLLTTPDSHQWLETAERQAQRALFCPRRKTQVYIFDRDTLKEMV